MRSISFLMISATLGMAWAGPKAPGTAALSRASVIEAGAEQELEGVGTLRALPSIAPDSVGPFETSIEDGTRFLVLRFSTGAPAGRLYIRNMALGVGAKLFLYGIDAAGTVTTVSGPFENVGPLQSGEFWTDAIKGSEIVVELQAGEDLPADIPFEVAGLVSADPSEAMPAVERRTEEMRTSLYRGVPLTHAVEDGIALFEGDIELGRADELPSAIASSSKNDGREAVVISGLNYRWPNGIIPYTMDPAIPNPSRVTAAIAHWNTVMTGYIQLVPRTTQTAYVHFARATTASKCSSSVGKSYYGQTIQVGDYCSGGNMIHEIGHTVGLWHEQGREDRNTYVKILPENMQAGTSNNFTQNILNGDDVGLYDYGSIMHYPAMAFSINGKPTIETIPAGIPIGQRNGLSAGDIAAVKAIYPKAPTQPSTVAITLSSIPAGQKIAADGVIHTTPVTLQWVAGSVHTVTAMNPAVVNGVRNLFVRWSDGGAQTHIISTPVSPTTYSADYSTSYAMTATATPAGSVVITPASADTFYPQNTSVTLEAIAPLGYCFTSWTGLVPGTPGKTQLSVSRPYNLVANLAHTTFSVSPAKSTVPATASIRQISVTTHAGCKWTAASPVGWITITEGTSGTGSGVVTISIAARSATTSRTAILRIAGQPIYVTQ